jgi:hypothetical protein
LPPKAACGTSGALFFRIARRIFWLVSISYPFNDPLGEISGTHEQPSRIFALFDPMSRIIWTLNLKVLTLGAREALPALRETNFKAFRAAGAQNPSFYLTWSIYRLGRYRIQHKTPPQCPAIYYFGRGRLIFK